MKINDKLYGFKVTGIRPLDELDAEFVEMVHEKTGLELVWIKRDEENKTFGIAFKTLPFDDTGVFHILEHSVLCGSEKYPVKEPFVDLLQTSMSTFLNALTFPDKTLYPISSRNDKDFFNLMSVYLDAVFCPAIYNKPEIFCQEGWHYEFDDSGNVSYKGVVFNEMKGALAGADELEEIALSKALFPNTPYKFVSGGDPASIPDLTYDKFIETHRKFYSPSNAYVFLDGSVDIEKTLEFIDGEYLSKAEKGERISTQLMQTPVASSVTELEYELGEDESKENKTRIAYANIIGSFEDREKLVAMQILSDVLCANNQSVLTKPVLSEGLAEDVIMFVNDSVAQPWVKIEVQNITDGAQEKAEALIFDKLRSLADNGIDRAQLEASMANLEFRMRERDYGDYPQGIIFSFIALETWLYGGDPMKHLVVGDIFDKLKNKIDDGYFEELIREILLDDAHRAKIILNPSYTLGKERREKEADRINKETSRWTDEQRAMMLSKQESLLAWQNSIDSDEAVATLPVLELSDVSTEPDRLPIIESKANGIRTLYHDVNCAGISNFCLYFDAEDLTEVEISQLSFLTDLLGKMKTSLHSEEELNVLGRLLFGNIDFCVASIPDKNNAENCSVKLFASFSTLEKNIDKALEFVCEILNETLLEDSATAFDIIKQLKTEYFQRFVMSGANAGMGIVKACYSVSAVSNQCAGGLNYYRWLCEQESDRNWNKLRAEFEALANKIICTSRATLSLTGGSESILFASAKYIGARLRQGTVAGNIKIKPWGKRRDGIVIPADISFACAGDVLDNFNGYNGSLAVASRMVSFAYLWNTVRVLGGAYGCGCKIDRNGFAACYSYRDPNASSSLEAYCHIADFLDETANSATDITGFIIGSVSSASPLLTPKRKGMISDEQYFAGITYEDKKAQLEEMLSVTADDLHTIACQIRNTFNDGSVCVFGNREQLEACRLDNIETL